MKKLIFIIFALLPLIGFSQAEKPYRSIRIDSLKALNGGIIDAKDTVKFEKPISIGGALDGSAILTVTSTTQGALMPRMNTAARDAITSPADGLLIYNNQTNQYEFFESTWQAIGAGGNTIYTANDNLTSDRIVTLGANSLTFSGNQTTFKGIDDVAFNFSIIATDNSDAVTFSVENNGVVNLAGSAGNYTKVSKGAGVRVLTANIIRSTLGTSGNLLLVNASSVLVHHLNTSTSSYLQNNNVNLGIDELSPTAKLHVSGNDATSGNFAFKVQDNAGTDFLSVRNDGQVIVGSELSTTKKDITLGVAVTTFATTGNVMEVTGDGGGNTIATITGALSGQYLIMIFVDGNVTITDDNGHSANTIDLSAAFTSSDDTTLNLIFDGTSWYEISRSVN